MTSKDFIISSIKDIVFIFEEIQCRYKYDNSLETHYIEILPAVVFKESKQLKNYRGQILDKFYELFPEESLVYLTEDSIIDFKIEEFKIVGNKFSVYPTFNPFFDKCFEPIISEYTKLTYDFFMKSYDPILFKDIAKKIAYPNFPSINNRKFLAFSTHVNPEQKLSSGNPVDTLIKKTEETKYQSVDENNYALAA